MSSHIEKVIEHYNKPAEAYEDFAGPSYSTADWSGGAGSLEGAYEYGWKQHMSHIKGINVLEIGYGRGGFSNYLTENGYVVTGIDVAETEYEFCKEKWPNINWKLGPYWDIEGHFDCIVSSEMVVHVKHHPHLWEHCASLQKSGDVMVHKILHTRTYGAMKENCPEVNKIFDGSGHYYTVEMERKWLNDAGYEVEVINIPEENYIITLEVWVQNMRDKKETLMEKFGEEYYWEMLNTWLLFLKYFKKGVMETNIFVCTKR